MKKLLLIIPVVLIAAFAGLYFYANRETENQLDIYIQRAVASGAYNDIHYESAEFGVNGTITITGLNVTDASNFNYLVDQVQLSDMDFINPFPRSISITANGFRFPEGAPELQLPLSSPELENFLGLIDGTQSVPLEIQYSHQYDPRNNEEFNSTINLGIPDSFAMRIDSSTRNIPYETLSLISDPAEAQAAFNTALMAAEVPVFSLSISDFGILEGLLANQANQQSRSIEEIRSEFMSMTQSLFLFAPADLQAQAIDLGNQLTAFLEGDRTFNLAIRPDMSGSIQQLQGPIMGAFFNNDYAQIIDLLNLEFYTE